jgi:hypothetical protein
MLKKIFNGDKRWYFAAFLVWIYVFLRALTISFTHEESLSYTIIKGDKWRAGTANNHYLNTWWMHLTGNLAGYSELSLRVGSLVAFALYLWGGIWLLLRSSSTSVRLAGFTLLFLNPFLLDFFGLARGYAWAMTGGMGMMVALYHLSAEGSSRTSVRADRWVLVGLLSALTGILGSLTMVNMLVPFVLVLLLQHFWSKRTWKINYWITLPAALCFGMILYFILSEIVRMKQNTDLYFGGTTGFIRDTLGGLVFPTLYRAIYTQTALEIVLYSVCVWLGIAIVLSLAGWRQKGPVRFHAMTGALFLCAIGWIFFQKKIWNTPFPTEHVAVFLLPFLGILFFSALAALAQSEKPFWSGMAPDFARIIALILVFHFINTANVQHTFTWYFDRHTRDVVDKISATRAEYPADRPVQVASHGLFEPTLNYYRLSRNLNWLAPVPGDGVRNKTADAYYTLWEDFDHIPNRDSVREVAKYHLTHSAIWKR